MASEWKHATLGSVSDSVRYGYTAAAQDDPTGTHLLRVTDIARGSVDWRTVPYCLISDREFEAQRLLPGDLLISRMGTIGVSALIERDVRSVAASYLIRFRLNRKQVVPQFMKYQLRSPDFASFVWSHRGGAVQPNINASTLSAFVFALPSLSEQRAIAHILGTLDDKIDLNRQMSATLEAMARALFESWFVRFDPVRAKAEGRDTGLPAEIADLFPDSFEESEIGEVPKGWRTVALQDLAVVEKGLSYKGAHLEDSGGTPMITLGCFAGDGAFKAQGLKRYSGKHEPKHTVSAGDLLVANTDITQDRVVLGSPVIVPESISGGSILFTHHVFAVRTLQPLMRRFLFFALLQRDFRETAKGHATGTTVLALPRNSVLEHRLCLPNAHLLEWAMGQAASLSLRAERQRVESDSLRSLRDTLLPKLISGDLRVPDAERFLADAGV